MAKVAVKGSRYVEALTTKVPQLIKCKFVVRDMCSLFKCCWLSLSYFSL